VCARSSGFWLIGFLVAEFQAVWHVARVLISRGMRPSESLLYLYRTNAWKLLDVAVLSVALASAVMRAVSHTVTPTSDEYLRSVAYLIIWARPLSAMSMNRLMGPLLASMGRMIAHDLTRYIVLQSLTVVAFSAALSALFAGDDGLSGEFLGTISRAMQTLAEQTLQLGDPVSGPLWMLLPESKAPQFGWIIMAAFGVVSSMLLLNLLIGMQI